MEYRDVLQSLEKSGTEQARKIYTNHGADIPLFGVSMKDLKVLAKKIKTNHELGTKLLFSNNVDAIYLSRWIVDPKQIRRSELEAILISTNYYMIIDNVVAHIAASDYKLAKECLEKWQFHENSTFRQAAYSLYTLILTTYDNNKIDLDNVEKTIYFIKDNIHDESNRVRYSMNGFIIASGIYIPTLTLLSKEVSEYIGKVKVYMGKTSCKVPYAKKYIEKVESMNKIGFKRKLT